MKKILLNGVDGNFGAITAKALLEKCSHEDLIFAAPTEKPLEKYSEMGIETRVANYDDFETLTQAFKDVETIIIISMPFVGPTRRKAHKIAIDAAVKAGTKRIVYTSIVGAGDESIDTYEVNDHVWTEAYIKEQPINHLILRDSQYSEAMVSSYINSVENTNNILANNMGEGKMAYISRDDCAIAAAYAAMSDWENRIIDVNGPEALTVAEYVAIANQVTGNKVQYQFIDDDQQYAFFDSIGVPRTTEEMWADTAKNFPFCSDGMVTFGRAIRLGQMSTFTNDFEKLTGRKPMTVKEIFEDIENHKIGERNSAE